MHIDKNMYYLVLLFFLTTRSDRFCFLCATLMMIAEATEVSQ
jgi:hypothetical protein